MGKDRAGQTTARIRPKNRQEKDRPRARPPDTRKPGNTRIRRISRHR